MKKQNIIRLSVAATIALGCAVGVGLAKTNINRVLAELVQSGKDRVLTFDKDVSVVLGDYNTGESTIGKMKTHLRNVSQLTDGYVTASHFVIYYDELNSYNKYCGFDQATVTSVSISYKVSTAKTLTVAFGSYLASTAININSKGATEVLNLTVSDEVQTITIDSGDFIDLQDDAKKSTNPGIYLKPESGTIDYYSVVVRYTCL